MKHTSLISNLAWMTLLGLGAAACGTPEGASSATASLKSSTRDEAAEQEPSADEGAADETTADESADAGSTDDPAPPLADSCGCAGVADAVFDACSNYGYDDDYCSLVRAAQLDGCLSFCELTGSYGGVGSAPEGSDPGALVDPGAVGTYRAYFCGEQQVLETEGIGLEEALANCELNAVQNPDRQLLCTLDGQVIYGSCEVPASPSACVDWAQADLERAPEFIDETNYSADEMRCDGPSFRRFDAEYGLWVGLVSCGTGYRFYLSETEEGTYLPAADYSGHGQDLCELVDPLFTIPIDDEIRSGGCTACSTSAYHSFVAGEVFLRAALGQRFTRAEALDWGPYQSSVITCASGPLECAVAVE